MDKLTLLTVDNEPEITAEIENQKVEKPIEDKTVKSDDRPLFRIMVDKELKDRAVEIAENERNGLQNQNNAIRVNIERACIAKLASDNGYTFIDEEHKHELYRYKGAVQNTFANRLKVGIEQKKAFAFVSIISLLIFITSFYACFPLEGGPEVLASLFTAISGVTFLGAFFGGADTIDIMVLNDCSTSTIEFTSSERVALVNAIKLGMFGSIAVISWQDHRAIIGHKNLNYAGMAYLIHHEKIEN